MSNLDDEGRVALVTGAASGLGRAIAVALATRGYSVFGTTRRPESAAAPGFPLVAMDASSDASVEQAIETVRSRAGRLDLLVNNVGARLFGAIEETSVEEAKALFETNFFGTHRVTRAALPLLRASAGRIVTISSLTGLNAIPFAGLYSASKWAVEAYTESLRHELRPFGVRVSLIEPGPVLSKGRPAPLRARAALPAYEGAQRRALDVVLSGDDTGIDAGKVVDRVVRVVDSPTPKLRNRVGAAATWLPRLKMLSWTWYEKLLRRRYALDRA